MPFPTGRSLHRDLNPRKICSPRFRSQMIRPVMDKPFYCYPRVIKSTCLIFHIPHCTISWISPTYHVHHSGVSRERQLKACSVCKMEKFDHADRNNFSIQQATEDLAPVHGGCVSALLRYCAGVQMGVGEGSGPLARICHIQVKFQRNSIQEASWYVTPHCVVIIIISIQWWEKIPTPSISP
jgi:hypothetical protein